MNAAGLLVATALAVGTACAGGPTHPTTTPAASPATAAGPSGARPGVPTVAGDDRQGIPRVGPDDAVLPDFTTRTTVLADNRPAVVVTLPEAVLFDFGSSDLRPEAEPALHAVADVLRQKPGTSAEVAGHTDSVGSAAYNLTLSQQRAVAVVDWLVDHGIARDRLRPVGYGAGRPVAGNATEEDRRRNRRVELTIS